MSDGVTFTWEQIGAALGTFATIFSIGLGVACRHLAKILERRVVGPPVDDPSRVEGPPTLSKIDAQLDQVHNRISAKFGELEPRVRGAELEIARHDQRLRAGGL